VAFFLTFQLLNSYERNLQAWIGLRQNPDQGNKWQWIDGKPLVYERWETDGQNHETNQPDCVAMEIFLGDWIPQNCQQAWGWICELPKGVYTEGQLIEDFPAPIESNRMLSFFFPVKCVKWFIYPFVSGTCGSNTPEGEWYFNAATDECLYFSRKTETWSRAQEICRELGSNLVTVPSNKSHDFITLKSGQFVAEATQFWIGLYKVNPTSLEHQWVDGQISFYRAWENGEPSLDSRSECVVHNSWSGKWRDVSCGRNLPFICHKSDRAPSITPTQDPSLGACVADWVSYRKSIAVE
jgi:hypothetical protein